MEVKIMGFEWEFNSKISQNDLLNKISALEIEQLSKIKDSIDNNQEFEDTNIENMVCVRKNDTKWFGIFIRFIDRAAFMKLLKSNNDLKIGSQNLQRNEKLSEVNFFLFDERKSRGVYTYYHQSNWVDTFNKYISSLYNTLNLGKKAEIETQIEQKIITKSAGKTLLKDYKPLQTSILVSPSGFETLINAMHAIDKISFSLKTDYISDDGYSPLKKYARSQKIEIGITDYNATGNKAAVIRDIIKESGRNFIKSMAVYGKSSPTSSLNDLVAKLNKNYEYYAKKDYLSVYGKINIDFQNLDNILNANTSVFEWLMSVINQI